MLDAKAAGAALVGGAAVAVYALWPTGRPVVAALLVVAGLVLWRVGVAAAAGQAGVSWAGAVERGAGRAAVAVGAGLAGQVLVVAVQPREFVVAVVLAPVVVALAALRGAVGWVGLGLVVPPVVGSLTGEHAVAVLAGLAVVAAGLAVRETLRLGWAGLGADNADGRPVTGDGASAAALARSATGAWASTGTVEAPAAGRGQPDSPPHAGADQAGTRPVGTFWTVLGATAASAAAGAGVAPVAALTGIVGEPVDPHPVAVLVAVVVPVVLALVAVGRRDVAGGLAVVGALAVPPVGLLLGGSPVPAVVLGGVALAAGLALGPLRRVVRWVSSDGLVAGLGCAAVALAVYGVPALAEPGLVRAGVTLALLLGALVLAWRLPAHWGGPLAGLGLAGIAVAGPWQRLGLVSGDPAVAVVALAAFSAVGLVVSAAVITALWLRHGHAGTAAGGALLLLHDLAWLLNTLGGDFARGPAPLLAVVGPLVLLALARPALPVVVAAAGFTLAAMTARTFVDAELRVELLRIAPLTPTDVLLTAQLPDNPAWVVPLLLVGLLGARTVAAPVVVLFGTQALLVALG